MSLAFRSIKWLDRLSLNDEELEVRESEQERQRCITSDMDLCCWVGEERIPYDTTVTLQLDVVDHPDIVIQFCDSTICLSQKDKGPVPFLTAKIDDSFYRLNLLSNRRFVLDACGFRPHYGMMELSESSLMIRKTHRIFKCPTTVPYRYDRGVYYRLDPRLTLVRKTLFEKLWPHLEPLLWPKELVLLLLHFIIYS